MTVCPLFAACRGSSRKHIMRLKRDLGVETLRHEPKEGKTKDEIESQRSEKACDGEEPVGTHCLAATLPVDPKCHEHYNPGLWYDRKPHRRTYTVKLEGRGPGGVPARRLCKQPA